MKENNFLPSSKKNYVTCEVTNKNEINVKYIFQLLLLPEYRSSKRVSLYLSTDDEIDTYPILKDIFSKDKEAYIPCYERRTMEMVKLHSLEEYNNLPVTKWNIKQPNMTDVRKKGLIASE